MRNKYYRSTNREQRERKENTLKDGEEITRVGREKEYQSKTENTVNSRKDETRIHKQKTREYIRNGNKYEY
jgi:DNA/RNA endonuclease YhcR with UshA esterase domain